MFSTRFRMFPTWRGCFGAVAGICAAVWWGCNSAGGFFAAAVEICFAA